MNKWETKEGIRFLERVGIRPGHTVVDFGCGTGHYSIPAAILVGPHGTVYAIDKYESELNTLKRKALDLGLTNIKTIKTSGELAFNIDGSLVDVFLLYDVLHYMEKNKREALYSEILQVLHLDSLLSVYPKHIATDNPADHFKTLTIDDVRHEIEEPGFLFKNKICGTMSHDESLNQGCVLNFRKPSKSYQSRTMVAERSSHDSDVHFQGA